MCELAPTSRGTMESSAAVSAAATTISEAAASGSNSDAIPTESESFDVSELAPEHVHAAAKLLAAQWPATGFTARLSALNANLRRRGRHPLPCHLVLLNDGVVAAHCRLQQACESADGFSAAVTSVVVNPAFRRRGLGRRLMAAAEAKAAAAGFGYLVLWTDDQQAFYASCGYAECESVTLLRPALATLGRASVEKLEALIASKASASAGDGGGAESVARPGCTWMRKRLLESVGCVALDAAELRDGVRAELSARRRAAAAATEAPAAWALSVPAAVSWERQVGPCCGIAALRMARATLAAMPPSEPSLDDCGVELRAAAGADGGSEVSILQEALQAGYSSDGELFDIHHLCDLAARCCALDAAVVSLDGASGAWEQILPSWLRGGGVGILPYDAEPGSHAPCERNGHSSHYLLLLGTARRRGAPEGDDDECVAAGDDCDGDALFVGLHGLSSRPLVASAAELAASNGQLNEVKPGQAGKWVVGEEGCRLRGRVLLLKRSGSESS